MPRIEDISQNYTAWKKWPLDFSYSEDDYEYYSREFHDFIIPGSKIIEIGFGNGGFLKYAEELGAQVIGIEIDDEILINAKNKGYTVYKNLDEVPNSLLKSIDLVVALDVFEHLSSEAIIKTLADSATLLRQGGRLIVRAPNGVSPFGRINQYGDCTHRTVITPLKMDQFCSNLPLVIEIVRNPARVLGTGTIRLKRIIQHYLRDLMNFIIQKIYEMYPLPFDTNIVIILKKECNPSTHED